MARPQKLESAAVEAWLGAHPGWRLESADGAAPALVRAYTFADFAAALSFAVRLGMLAEKRDHHPDILIGWARARVLWTTHDAGGITELDLALAEGSDRCAGSTP